MSQTFRLHTHSPVNVMIPAAYISTLKLGNDRKRKYLILCQIKTVSIEMWSMAMNGRWHLLGFRTVRLSAHSKRVALPSHISNPNELNRIPFNVLHMWCSGRQTKLLSYWLVITKIVWSRDCYNHIQVDMR